MSSLLCAIVRFVVFKGYGSHPSTQITLLHMYVTCHERGPCAGVWKDQSKSICMGGKIPQSACPSAQDWVSIFLTQDSCCSMFACSPHSPPPFMARFNEIFRLGFSPLTNYVLPSHYTQGNERVDRTLRINSHKSCSSSLSVWILSFN